MLHQLLDHVEAACFVSDMLGSDPALGTSPWSLLPNEIYVLQEWAEDGLPAGATLMAPEFCLFSGGARSDRYGDADIEAFLADMGYK